MATLRSHEATPHALERVWTTVLSFDHGPPHTRWPQPLLYVG
jgi:hypothetical protein